MVKLNPNLDVYGQDIAIWEKGQHGGRTRPLNAEVLFNNLVEVKKVFEKYNITFWLSHGTMLGVFRDSDIIPWDDDIDIGLLLQDKPKVRLAEKELRELGFYIPPEGNPNLPVKGTGNDANMPFYDFVAIKDGEKIEGWFFEKKGDFYIYDEPRCGSDLKHPAKYYDELQNYEWKNIIWKIPNHIQDWLLLMYGTGWNKVDKNRKYNNQKFDSQGNPIQQNH